jgi:hypothetical protein
MIKTNDLKKDQVVYLRNGWKAVLFDSKKGNTRLAKVYGDYTELGSIYSHDIVSYLDINNQVSMDIEYTKSQLECKRINQEFGFGY